MNSPEPINSPELMNSPEPINSPELMNSPELHCRTHRDTKTNITLRRWPATRALERLDAMSTSWVESAYRALVLITIVVLLVRAVDRYIDVVGLLLSKRSQLNADFLKMQTRNLFV